MSTHTPAMPGSLAPHEVPIGPRLAAVLALAYRARRPVLLEGPTGIGKSDVVQSVARALGVQTTVLDLSLLEPPDLVGLPVIENGRTSYALPSILPRDGSGILMLEELNRAERYIQQPALQLLTARRLHEYVLPDGWVCFAAVNPAAGDYHVVPLDRALRARFLTVGVRADRGAWIEWASAHEVHPAVIDLARTHDAIFDDVPPRTWTYVSHVLRALTGPERSDEALLRDALGGYLPPAWTESLLQSRDTWESQLEFDVRSLVRDDAPGRTARQQVRAFREKGLTDRLDEVVRRLLPLVRGPEVGILVADQRFNLAAFEALLAELPGDQRDRLQEALAHNGVATSLVDLHPLDVLQSYAGSGTDRRVREWKADPNKHHRLGLLVTSLVACLDAQGRSNDFRRNNAVRINLGLLLSQLGERHAMRLVDTLLKLGITPIRPS